MKNLKKKNYETIKKHDSSIETNKGITLISLVITIIVLLILAGIAIQMLTGDNGILNEASDAEIQTDIARNGRKSQFNIY
jgi:type II secretory pathway pseudopilin PulG